MGGKHRRPRVRKPHPLARRTGIGPPFAPAEWRWRTGTGVNDMCFYSPAGNPFRSKLKLRLYLAHTPGTPAFSEFKFRVNVADFKDGELPGELIPAYQVLAIKQGPEASYLSMPNKRRMLAIKSSGEVKDACGQFGGSIQSQDINKALTLISSATPVVDLSIDERLEFFSSDLCPSRFKPRGSRYKYSRGYSFLNILSSPKSYIVLWKNANIMQKFLNEAQSLKDKSDAELNQLRAVVLNRSLDPLNLSRYPESALRVFFLLLRNQEAPSFLEKNDLTQLCSKWSCKRKQFWCFLEAQGEQLYADVGFKADQCLGQRKSIQPAAMVLAADNIFELRPDAASLRNLHVTKVKETVNAHVNGIFNGAMGHSQCLIKPEPMDDEDLLHTQDTSPGTVNERHLGKHVNEELINCNCEVCSRDPLFCYGCSCSLCRELISQTEIWSFIRCIECSHVCHLECAWKARKAGVVKEMGLDGEFLCPSCLEKNDLITFWKERVKGAVTSMDSFTLEKQLFSAVVVLNGTQREMYESIHGQLRDLHSAVVNNAPSLHIQQTLCEIGEKLNALPDSQMPSDVFGELSKIVPTGIQSVDLLALEAKVFEYQKKAELNYAEWLEAEKHAETQRSLFKDAEERLKKAEEDTNIRADYAKASKKLWQRSKSRLLLLKRSFKAKVTSKEQIESHKKVLDTELMELGRLQDQLKSFNSRSSNFPGKDIPSLKDDLKVQRKRIQAAQAMLEHIIFLEIFFL